MNWPVCGGRTSDFGLSERYWHIVPMSLGKSRSLVRTGYRLDTTRVFEFVKANQANFPIATMCRVLGVSTSGYYAWLKRPPSQRFRDNAVLLNRIHWIHLRSRGTYGVPRIHAELCDEGVHVGRKRVARLMRVAGLQGVSRRKKHSNNNPTARSAAGT